MTKYNETKEEYIARMKRIVANSQQAQNAIRDHKTRSATEERVGKQKGKPKPNPYTDPNMKEWEDYKECPITGMRHRNLKASHPNGKALPQTDAEEYFYHFPELQGMSKAATKKNSEAQLQLAYDEHGNPVLDDNGKHLTVNQVVQLKKAITMNEVDEATGKTKNQLLGEKTRNSHLNNIDQYGRNGYEQLAAKNIIKSSITRKNEYAVNNATNQVINVGDKEIQLTSDHKSRYKRIVEFMVRKMKDYDHFPTHLRESLSRNDKNNPDALQIDHKYSITAGLKNGISPILIGSHYNVEIIKWKDNFEKFDGCSIELDELFDIAEYSKARSDKEYNAIMLLIDEDVKCDRQFSVDDIMERAGLMNNFYQIIDEIRSTKYKE